MRNRLFFLVLVAMIGISAVLASNYPTRMYLIGDGAPQNNWDLNALTCMVTTAPGIYTWTGDLNDGRMKFVPGQNWEPSYGPVNATAIEEGNTELRQDIIAGQSYEMEYRVDNSMPDKSCNMTAGRYKLTLDITGEIPLLTVEDGIGLTNNPTTPITNPAYLYPIGDATEAGWELNNTTAIEETSFNSGIYTSTLTLKSGSLKFLLQKDWGKMYGATTADQEVSQMGTQSLSYSSGSNGEHDNKFKITFPASASYQVTINLNTNTMTIYPEKIYMVGPGSNEANDWIFSDNAIMTNISDGKYNWSGNLYNGQLKFFVYNDFGTIAYGASIADEDLSTGNHTIRQIAGSDDDFKFMAQEGVYTLTLDLTRSILTVSSNGTSTNLIEENQIKWYINENQILCNEASGIDLYNLNGSKIATSQENSLGIHGVTQGVYILVIKKGDNRQIQKIVIQ